MPTILNIFLFLLATPAMLSSIYLLVLTLASARLPPLPCSSRRLRFDIVVPAHNEEAGIVQTINSLYQLDWPASQFRIHVVADNCTDRTPELANAAGADVLIRHNAELRGKGYALAHGFRASLTQDWADALVVVDADTTVSPNLLEAFAVRIEQGEHAVQAYYGIRNPLASWRTRLITVAQTAFHKVRSRARERMGLSCGIRGNGWCVTNTLLQAVPYQSFSLTEDVEYGITLGRTGQRIAYADEAHVNADMVVSARIARSQRQRWESGRMALARKSALSLLWLGLQTLSLMRLDLAFDLLVLPLSWVVLNVLLLLLCSAALLPLNAAAMNGLWAAGLCVLALLLYVGRGWQLSGTGLQGLTALLYVPRFLVWKVATLLGRKSSEWIRTERERP